MRLNLFIAKSGFCSRRKADSLIKEGKVKVNGKKVSKPYLDVNDSDRVEINDKQLFISKKTYIVLNKPKGVVTTKKDKFAPATVMDLLPQEFKGLYPVGRLDKNSTGLIILTNDGDLCQKLTHPKFCTEKEYLVELRGVIKDKHCLMAKKGLMSKGEHLKVDKISIVGSDDYSTVCKVIIHEGKKRHLRRLFKELGFVVLGLKRTRVANLTLGNLALGKFKELEKDKIYKLLLG